MKVPSSVLAGGLSALLLAAIPAQGMAATLNVPNQFPTIQAAIDAAGKGDTVLVAPGTYSESLDLTGKTLTLRSQSGATNTTIVGTSGHVLAFQGNDRATVVSGFTLQNPPNSTESVYVYNASPTLTDNRFAGTTGSLIAVWAYGSSLVLERNLFYGWTMGINSNSAVSLGSFVAPVIRDNVFYNNAGGLYLGATNLQSGQTPQADVANNTFADNGTGVGIDSPADVSQLVFRNNIVLGGTFGFYLGSGSGTPLFQNNIAYGGSIKNYSGLADPTGANGNLSADPRLGGLTALNFQPDAGSPAIDAGLNAAVTTGDTDFTAATRIVAGSSGKPVVDIGAVEYAGPPPTVSLQSSANAVSLGAPVTLTWSSSNATNCVAGGAWSGTLSLSGTRTITPAVGQSTFTVTCSNAIASRQQSAQLTVYPLPTARITLNPSTVYQNQTFTETWSSTSTTGCTGSGGWAGPLGTSGSTQAQFAVGGTYQFNMTCTGPGGNVSTTATLTVISGPTITFESTDLPVNASTRITWAAFPGATACVASGAWSGAVPTSGAQIIGPLAAGRYAYTLTCTAPGVSADSTQALSVYAPSAPAYEGIALSGPSITNTIPAFGQPGTLPAAGGLDGKGYVYNSAALPQALTALSQTFDYSPTALSSQTIQLFNGPISALTILATGVNGNQPAQKFTIGYSDGSSSTYTQSLSDWHVPQSYAGETIATSMTSRITSTGAVQAGIFYIYAYRIPVDATRFATTLTLPSNRNVVVVAVNATLAPIVINADLGPSTNVYGVAAVGQPAANGGIDTKGYAIDGAMMPSEFTYQGQLFLTIAAGRADAVSGATIPLVSTGAQSVSILAVGVNGNQSVQPFVVTYADGTSTTFRQSVSDWHTPQNYPGESLALAFKDRVTSSGALQAGAFNAYVYSFPTDASRPIKSVSLPSNRNVVVFAVNTVSP